ncbi:hypothetical protein RclHR1_00010071 [Rhizophagus clarus]|uniref:Sacsin/Nov domain-containing protein n=1 Tax=Rhizophagus clarus TaxID=94130 RepID=A0A2Z6QBX8_9GLOM|nr:hypothetical protein RclHR1_00010071 [Rhizophagus clarus]GES75130.1 hypothetical protein GLOIN_2v381231 [Rhizophagus clarus]
MSLDTFRNQILSSSSEGRVEVNQRDLIDKILARYSCKFVIYRELMQNSDDAESSSVKIIFKTNGSKITRILFKNNGFAFRSEDWDRLVKIAEGNPDEQKIGAFGVGFYSLFSVTENPFVSSGGQGMAFYWRGKQVFTKQGPIDDDDKGWTTFLMDTREPLEVPNIEEFTRFLVNSLGFTENLQDVSMYIDDVLIIQLSKKMKEPTLVEIAPSFNTFSPKNMFHLTSVDFRGVQLDVKRLLIPAKINIKQLRSNMYQTVEESILFRIANGNLDVKVSKEFSAKMERITKKKPPNNTLIQMIFAEFDERNLSSDYYKNLSPIFKDLISYPEQGKIYIGFPTNQTTGSCSHLAARVIPTMERELIDFAEQTLAEYNNEMLCLAGTLSRILYEFEMAQMTNFYNGIISSDIENNEETKRPEKSTSKSRPKRSLYKWLKKRVLHFNFKKRTPIVQMTQYDFEKISPHRKWLEKWATYAIAHFTYNSSTPNMQVSTIAETLFSTCLKQNMLILSTQGVLPISNVRLPNPKMAGFIKTIPIVPKTLLEQCNAFFSKAKEIELIVELGLQDVLDELKSRTLSDEEIINLLRWWISCLSKENHFDTELLKFTRISDSSQTLNTIQFYLNSDKIPSDIDIPFEVLPYNISKNFTGQELENRFGWTELPLVNWAKYIVKKPELESDFKFAEKVHHVIAKNLDNVSQEDKDIIRQLFVEKKCIPTEFGMKFPNESYFQSVDLFPNLPTIKFQDFTSSIRRLMEYLGVRMIVELKLILKRLVNREDCYHIHIIKYLASMSDDLNEDEKNILKNESIWPKENLLGLQSTEEIQRFVIGDLYIPSRSCRELGLPIIDWNVEWSNNSKEGKFLIELGLQKYPKLETILKLAAPPTDSKIRELALKFFIDNFNVYSEYYKPKEVNIAFLPCSSSNYAKPLECFINDECTIMNFQTIRKDLRSKVEKFGVRQHPDHDELVKRLTENPPHSKNKAKEIFEYLNSQQKDFTYSDWNILNNFEFIPIQDENQPNEKLIKPCECFFKPKEESLNEFFLCVDFGTKANEFLAKCGVKEPSPDDFVRLSIDSSHKLWNLYIEKYLSILKKINPNLEKILELSAPPTDPKIREISLKYFIDNFDNKYLKYYKSDDVDIAFLPCSNSNYAKPSECFISDSCMIMNFQTIREDLRSKAGEKFGVQQHPNNEKLVKRLTENPPQNKNEATKVFEYLNTQQNGFTDFDWDTLKNFEFIPIQGENKPDETINKLIRPCDCFFKLKEESLNEFFLCIDFGTKANEFLAKCGVKEPSSDDFIQLSIDSSHKLWNLYIKKYLNILKKINPNLETILELAAPPTDPKIREMALKYFIEQFDKNYLEDYNSAEVNIAFLPCSNSNTYAKPSECFINDRCMIMNFQTIRKDLRSKAEKFGVHQHPNHEMLVKRLIENPPQDKNEAMGVFEYLSSQQGNFTDSDWDNLKNFEFIPIQNESQSNEINYKLIKPRDCFFKFDESLNEFFPCVDFGTKANTFLAKCGVNDEPSSADFARLLLSSSHKLWNLYKNDIKKYLEKIKINENLDNITSGKMKDDDKLIAIKVDPNNKGKNNYSLASIKEIYINDEEVYQRALNPLVAPKNLESLYKKLGCKSLYMSVKNSVVPYGTIQKTKYSQQLQRIIRERAGLFYLNYSEKEIRNDKEWLKKLKVREIEYMETRYKLESITNNERNNITANIQKSMNSWILYVTPNSNLIDVSQHILNNIFKSHDSKDISYSNTILTAPLSSLKHMGILLPTSSLQQDDMKDIDIKSFENEKLITIASENTQDLRKFLQDSIKSRYSNNINCSSIKTFLNKNQIKYCDIIPGYSMRCVGNSHNIELYVSNDVDQSEILSQSRIAPLSQFINMLKDLASVFEVTSKAIHIFYDNGVNSIAFNRDGELFFNFKFYLGLHEQESKTKPTIDAMTYWFMIYCHVLSHNFVELHNSEFEYYYSSFAKIYMQNFLELMKRRKIILKTFNIKTFWKNFSRILTRN